MADADPDALEREIERTRAELARTVDAIADRVSPKRVAERGVAKVRANAEHLVETVSDFVGGSTRGAGVTRAPGTFAEDREGWEDDYRAQNIAPILIGVGAVLVVGAAVLLLRRRRRK